MYKLAIVDDESLVRVGFQTIIDWPAVGYEIQGTFRNGREAWEFFGREGYPDVLLTDIRMPEMDGLSLIRHIRETDAEMIIIILSSYDEFAYARQSMQLGVHDYIPKHLFDPQELLSVLNKLTARKSVKQANVSVRQNRTTLLQEEKQRLMMQTRDLPGIVESTVRLRTADYPVLAEQLAGKQVAWMVIKEWSAEKAYSPTDLSALSFLLQDVTGKSKYAIGLGVDHGVYHSLILGSEHDGVSDAWIADLVRDWSDTVRNQLAVHIAAGVSEMGSFGVCKSGRRQAEHMADRSFFGTSGVYVYDKSVTGSLDSSLREWQQHLLHRLPELSPQQIADWLESITPRLGELATPAEANSWVKWIYATYIKHREPFNYLTTDESGLRMEELMLAWEAASPYPTWRSLKLALIQALDEYDTLHGVKKRSKPWLKDVFAYVEAHYEGTIRLEDAALKANLNVNYFSHRFSQEMGITFLEYVTRVRIHKAKELIRKHRLSAEEAASRVGYPNASYFVKVFKKVTGQTLSEYRQSLT